MGVINNQTQPLTRQQLFGNLTFDCLEGLTAEEKQCYDHRHLVSHQGQQGRDNDCRSLTAVSQ